MDERIYAYLTKERNNTTVVANSVGSKVCKYEDIKNEFLKWLEKRSYDFENPLTIAGYTAKDIARMAPFMDGVGVYNFMVTLRDNPERAQAYIKEGFRIL